MTLVPDAASARETIVFFHAHPDDEAIFSGGTMARLALAGHRVVVVMATSGGQGRSIAASIDDPTAPLPCLPYERERELAEACALLGVARVVLFRYEDSGIDSPPNPSLLPFSEIAVDEVAQRLADVIAQEAATALVVYDEGGIYGHVDHLHVHRSGVAAARLSSIPTLYEMTVDREYLHFVDTHLIDHARESLPHVEHIGVPTVFVSTTVDVRMVLPQKRAAIAAHASQVQSSSSVMRLSESSFREVYGYEWFVRHGPRGVIESLSDQLTLA
ncbi:MAG: PIG-L deacetylase family protein [Acidimicrobiales bacterium]